LIIGDAKQSIYRFRNADSSLISRKVPQEFGCDQNAASSSSVQNTNWRSELRIVQFNNSFFSFLAGELNRTVGSGISPERRDFEADYLNVVQHPHHKKECGYVEVRCGVETDLPWSEYVLGSITGIVEDVLARGFRMRDIAVLVDRNSEGEDVIATFTEYNSQLPAGGLRLEYVSEQSLKLTSSAAVALVVSVLETICRGADPEVRAGEERARRGVADWSEVACNFKFFALRHPELSTPDCLAGFFEEGGDNEAIGEMLKKMQAVTLPALVESIVAEFIPADIRRTDAVFLAAFQDMVLEYCESRPSDIASFLRWWSDKKKSASISSPEEMDAITVMTVHKSKGLEFPIVIVPFANTTFKDGSVKKEWRWIKPAVVDSEKGSLPPFIPIPTASIVEGTSHEHVLNEYYDLRKMDSMNSIYVAFTRAARELYIFSKPSGRTEDPVGMAGLFGKFFEMEKGQDAGAAGVEMMQSSAIGISSPGIFTYGEKSIKDSGENRGPEGEEHVIADYAVRPTPDFLLYRMEDLPEVVDAEDPELSDDADPRSEGNILHEIMQEVRHQSDIPRAVRRMAIKGVITSADASRLGA
ncbi:MAG: UvrD-helicase domain-containing protein, partial [Muribaculaceae bacterium]|nr:UvrD-helicase domain-containing protein [Muribaculaceae bacterium]